MVKGLLINLRISQVGASAMLSAVSAHSSLSVGTDRRAHGFSDAFSSKARGVGEAPRRHVIKDVPQGCKPAPTVAETS